MNRIDIFNQALNLISNNDIRDFCKVLLENADDYFFTEPASSSGKYHPKFALGQGGLARHSIAVAMILHDMLRTDCYQFDDREKDLMVCGAIVHDIKKYGESKKHTVKEHPQLSGEYIIQTYNEHQDMISQEEAEFIADVVRTHMGQWGDEKPETDAQKLVHMADCLSSRKFLNIEFEEQTEAPMLTNEVVEKPKPGEYVLPFGKFNGQKLKDIDISYVHFLAEKFSGQDHPAAINAKLFLKESKQ